MSKRATTKVIGGNALHRRYAYRHRRRYAFGIMAAADRREARQTLGAGFDIETTWMTDAELQAVTRNDRGRIAEIVSSLIPGCLDIGATQ